MIITFLSIPSIVIHYFGDASGSFWDISTLSPCHAGWAGSFENSRPVTQETSWRSDVFRLSTILSLPYQALRPLANISNCKRNHFESILNSPDIGYLCSQPPKKINELQLQWVEYDRTIGDRIFHFQLLPPVSMTRSTVTSVQACEIEWHG